MIVGHLHLVGCFFVITALIQCQDNGTSCAASSIRRNGMTTLSGQHPHVARKGLYLEAEEIGSFADQRLDVTK